MTPIRMKDTLISLLQNEILVYTLMAIVPLLWVIPFALFAVWWERKISAHMQDRLGPMRTGGWHGWSQTIADILKLIQKEDIIPSAADRKLFMLAPYVVFAGSYAAYAAIPFSAAYIGSEINIGLFYVISISSLVVIGLLMAGWASNNKWSLFGALRSAAQIVSYEIPVALSLLAVVMVAGTFDLQADQSGAERVVLELVHVPEIPFPVPRRGDLFCRLAGGSEPDAVRHPRGGVGAGGRISHGVRRACVSRSCSSPSMPTCSRSPRLRQRFFWAGGTARSANSCRAHGGARSGSWAKGMAFIFVQMWLRWTLPRLRVDQLMYVGWKVLIPFSFLIVIGVGFWVMLAR